MQLTRNATRKSKRRPFYLIAAPMLWCLSSSAAHALDAVSLFVNQCLEYNDNFSADFSDATTLERQTLGLQNLNDRVQYYRQFQLSSDDQEWLLQCQLAVATTTTKLLHAPELTTLIEQLATSSQPQQRALAARYRYFQQQQFNDADKIRLTTAQTAIKQRLSSSSFQLDFGSCALGSPADEAQPFDQSIARYLMAQPDEDCRYKVWSAFQTRAVDTVKADLATLTDIRDELAQAQGFHNYAELQFQHTLIGNANNTKAFLQAMQQSVVVTPWNIGQQLRTAAKTPFAQLSQAAYLQQLTAALATLGVRLETINHEWLRLWHQQRLLGDVMLTSGKPMALLLRRSVVGHQTGISYLSLPADFSRPAQVKRANNAMAEMLATMAASGRYSLLNEFAAESDTQYLAQDWLAHYLDQQLAVNYAANSREALFQQYQQQFERINALAALKFYTEDRSINLSHEFAASFGRDWPQAALLPFTFPGIADAGPLYFSHLLQQQLSSELMQHTQNCDAALLFNRIVVNEQQQDVAQLLQQIWPEGMAGFIAQLADEPSANTDNADSHQAVCPLTAK
ncbi:M3 family metallopeptidase [Shewanella sp. C32]|uniref:M3 family metallopeptidase n=1 Tax=Shewanella electrica TaxID=515560 RepID=A0ABT2FL28_9GAMM|nr:M3 family metallopeptidase [Shewanella electrica]MCH1923818.1 M3 family metallopeptidase [Shewanella electrica]MCS4557036.1 M3 family metallopeptidase [Shewanella electrica]